MSLVPGHHVAFPVDDQRHMYAYQNPFALPAPLTMTINQNPSPNPYPLPEMAQSDRTIVPDQHAPGGFRAERNGYQVNQQRLERRRVPNRSERNRCQWTDELYEKDETIPTSDCDWEYVFENYAGVGTGVLLVMSIAANLNSLRAPRRLPKHWFLASCPGGEMLKVVCEVVRKYDGVAVAGEPGDTHSAMMKGVQGQFGKGSHGWRNGMIAKLAGSCDQMKSAGHRRYVAVCIAGGVNCEWEKWQMSKLPRADVDSDKKASFQGQEKQVHLRSCCPGLRLKVCTNARDLEVWLRDGAHTDQCV